MHVRLSLFFWHWLVGSKKGMDCIMEVDIRTAENDLIAIATHTQIGDTTEIITTIHTFLEVHTTMMPLACWIRFKTKTSKTSVVSRDLVEATEEEAEVLPLLLHLQMEEGPFTLQLPSMWIPQGE
jgi:hypothetical protein